MKRESAPRTGSGTSQHGRYRVWYHRVVDQSETPTERTVVDQPTVTYHAHDASEAGALPGHGFRCSCGTVQSTSLGEREARSMAAAHLAWHGRRERQAVAENAVELDAIIDRRLGRLPRYVEVDR